MIRAFETRRQGKRESEEGWQKRIGVCRREGGRGVGGKWRRNGNGGRDEKK